MKSFMLYQTRKGMQRISTIAKPAKIAPATKYGGKIVACQPGTCDTEKSKDTMEWTESTSGVESPASSRYAISYLCQCRALPRQPQEKIPYRNLKYLFFARSRKVARSGINPTYQNSSEIVA